MKSRMGLAVLRRPTPLERGRYRPTRTLSQPARLPAISAFVAGAAAPARYTAQCTTRGVVYRLGAHALARETSAEVVLPNEANTDAIAFALTLARQRFGAPIVVDADPVFAGKALAIASDLGVVILGAVLDRLITFIERAHVDETAASHSAMIEEEAVSAELSRRPGPLAVAAMLLDAQRPREGYGYFGAIVGIDDRWILLRGAHGKLTRHELHHFSSDQPPDVDDKVAIFYPPIPEEGGPKKRRKIKPAVAIDPPQATIVVTNDITVPQARPAAAAALPSGPADRLEMEAETPTRPRKPKKSAAALGQRDAAKAPRPSRRRPG